MEQRAALICLNGGFLTDDWRTRIASAIRSDGRSLRAISIAAGQGEAYVWELLNTSKEPSVSSLMAVCSALGVSASQIIEGYVMDAASERLLKAFSRMSPEQQAAFLKFLDHHN